MAEIDFVNLLIVGAAAFAAPLVLGLAPSLMLPAVVLEIVAGIAIGPSGLGWVEVDEPVRVLAILGLAFLLFSAGLEVDLQRLRGPALRLALSSFLASLAIGAGAGLILAAANLVDSPLLVAIVLSATSLGVVIPVLKDADEIDSDFGQLVAAACSIADFGAIILLTLFFSGDPETGLDAKLVLLGGFVGLVAALALALREVERSGRISRALVRLQDTTAQIRIRGAFVLLLGFAVLAEQLGLETILGAFAAGAVLSALDRDEAMTHPEFRAKIEAVGFGVFVPVFFVSSGLEFDLDALVSSADTLLKVPVFLAALLAVRGLPALLYRGRVDSGAIAAAGLLQATSLPFIVTATMIGRDLGLVTASSSAAFIAAGLVSVVAFPVAALAILRGRSVA